MTKPVCVILVNYNTPKHTTDCISSILANCDNQLFEIVVVDNASHDDSLQLLQQAFPQLHYIANTENLGFAEGNNVGLRYSIDNRYTYSLVINTDTIVEEDIISALKQHLDTFPKAGAVQPAIYWLHNRTQLWNGPGYFNKLIGDIRSDKSQSAQKSTDTIKQVDWITGCCMFIRNSALLKSSLFNKQFFLYYEDVELSFRIKNAGYELHYLPSIKILHEAGASGKTKQKAEEGYLNPVIHYYISRNRIWFLRRYGASVFYPIYVIGSGTYYLALLAYLKIRGRNKKVSNLLKGIKDGLFTPQSVIWPNN